MRNYEIMFIVRPDIQEDGIKKAIEELKSALTKNNAKITSEKAIGQKELAYEINKFKNGYYFQLNVEAGNEAINEFERIAIINESVIRHLVIKIEN